ncbi:MAG: F0F1 ATP synthase subunit epsilon [Bacteroidota bacterium]
MFDKPFQLRIITPSKVVFQGEAVSVSVPGTRGGFQVLHGHAPCLSSLEVGVLKVKDAAGTDTVYATSGGFVEVRENLVLVLVETAERPEEIDAARAEAARDRAGQRIRAHDRAVDEDRARAAILRALNRLRLARRD